jgi:sterol desaturase/sphingolipid hydroxylase (fatty acid hydroxylase superfamily)
MALSLREQWLILFSTPLYLVVIGLEILLTHLYRRKKAYTFKDSMASLYLMLVNTVIDVLFRVVYVAVLQWFFLRAVIHWENAVAYWIVLLLAEDFVFYWLHRIDHTIRLFWAVHVTHHSSQQFNFTVGFRSSVFEPLYRFVYFIPLAWLGFMPLDIIFMYSATQIWGTLVHTEMKINLGWPGNILVTPSHHRVHHASNAKYLDKNMGMVFIIWDKLFGTFQKELPPAAYQPIKYGLTKNIEKPNAFNLIFSEWQQMRKDIFQKGLNFKQRLSYLFGSPGWSHDNSRHTSKQLRAIEEASASSLM